MENIATAFARGGVPREEPVTAFAQAGGGPREFVPEPPHERPHIGEYEFEIPEPFDVGAQKLAQQLPKLSSSQREVLQLVSYWIREFEQLQRRGVRVPETCTSLYLKLLNVESFLTNMGRGNFFTGYNQTEIFAVVRPFRNMLTVLKHAEVRKQLANS